jgi:hypothetical protein
VQPSPTPTGDAFGLWYELGRLYAAAGEDARRAGTEGFIITLIAAAQVLLSAPIFRTSWAGPFATLIPIAAGLSFGGVSFCWRRVTLFRRREALRHALAAEGEDAERPAAGGLDAYYDAQLILLRSEYEFLRSRGTKRALLSARLFEASFGFMPEDEFECGPLNVTPDSPGMRDLRDRWDARLASSRALGKAPPALGLREDAHYRVFPREMTVPAELATRSAYLAISCGLLRERYGKSSGATASEEIRRRSERDLGEYAAITGRRAR